MATCPYCAEDIKDDAIECKHCGSMLVDSQEKRGSRNKEHTTPSFRFLGSLLFLAGFAVSIYYYQYFYTSAVDGASCRQLIAELRLREAVQQDERR